MNKDERHIFEIEKQNHNNQQLQSKKIRVERAVTDELDTLKEQVSKVNNREIKNYLNYKLEPYDKVPNLILNKINKNGEKQYPYGTLNKNIISKVKSDIRHDIERDVAKRNKISVMNDLIRSHKGGVEEEKAHEIIQGEKAHEIIKEGNINNENPVNNQPAVDIDNMTVIELRKMITSKGGKYLTKGKYLNKVALVNMVKGYANNINKK